MTLKSRMYQRSFTMVERLPLIVRKLHAHVWLMLLGDADLQAITQRSYAAGGGFDQTDHVLRGFWPWERAAVVRLFTGKRSVLVACAGAGREMIALQALGHKVVGFDSSPALVAAGHRLLETHTSGAQLELAAPSEAPFFNEQFDALMVGRGSYHHIAGQAARIDFLRACVKQLVPGSPIFISDVMCRSRPTEILSTSYLRGFTKVEFERELQAAGVRDVTIMPTPFPGSDCLMHATGKS